MQFCYKFFLLSIGGAWHFSFNVKFYPPDPAQLSEDITRYLKVGCEKGSHVGGCASLKFWGREQAYTW